MRSRDVCLWPLLLVLLMIVAELFGDAGRAALEYERSLIAQGQWWRLLTGSLVHLGWYHLMLNAIGIGVLVLLCPQALPPRIWLRRLALLALGMSLCLYAFVPNLQTYVGMSGVIHGLFVLGLVPQLLRRAPDGHPYDRRDRIIAGLCLAYLLGKLGWELVTGTPVSDEAAIGGHVVTESHLYGSLSAFVYGLVFGSFSGREARSASPQPLPQESIK
ncbi:rhombosortase [Solimonas soli]|uniref:rhombosortase n=1 Tax=Solimonas soli TaxID=413479 RepID=UPI001FDF38D4|nr:rhombosortase [Solimonas soli]